MSDPIRIALFSAAVVQIALINFRRQLSSFLFKTTKVGFEAELKTHPPASVGGTNSPPTSRSKTSNVNIKRNRLFGWGNKIEVERDNTNIEENTQLGAKNEITAKSDLSCRKKK